MSLVTRRYGFAQRLRLESRHRAAVACGLNALASDRICVLADQWNAVVPVASTSDDRRACAVPEGFSSAHDALPIASSD